MFTELHRKEKKYLRNVKTQMLYPVEFSSCNHDWLEAAKEWRKYTSIVKIGSCGVLLPIQPAICAWSMCKIAVPGFTYLGEGSSVAILHSFHQSLPNSPAYTLEESFAITSESGPHW